MWLFRTPPACLHSLTGLKASERQASLTRWQAGLLDHRRLGSLLPSLVLWSLLPVGLFHTMLQAPGAEGSHFLLGATCGLEGLTSKAASCCHAEAAGEQRGHLNVPAPTLL